MEAAEFKNIWKAHDTILDKSMRLNILCIETIQSQKSKSKLKPLLVLRSIEAFVNLIITFFLLWLLSESISNINMVILISAVIIFSVYSLYLCITQIIIIVRISYSDNVTEIQSKLSKLQTHILDYFRLSFLVIPFWLVYPIIGLKLFSNAEILDAIPASWWIGNIIFCMIFVPLSIYAYRQVSYKNIHKRWVRFFIRNAGGKSVTKAMEFLKVIDEFKKN